MTADGSSVRQPSGSTDALLVTFVPSIAPELGARAVPSWTPIAGSMLSAEISGVTALSERLAGTGKARAEEAPVADSLSILTCGDVSTTESVKLGGGPARGTRAG